MKYLFTLAIFCCIGFTANAQSQNPNYNKALADSLGADDYGMKQYVLAILKTGSNTTTDKEKLNGYFRGHMENIGRLAKEGKLVVAGPLGKNDRNYRGIFILNVKTVEEAEKLVETDPAVKARIFDIELYPWYGSAALPMYLDTHKVIEKQNP
ncbi:YciI family protein [Pontibacter pudoricolor]|uniref:YciI family protein n=1 Tax=Pontibacter pudoricolor TaxID=2694930 RepID=UPI001390FD8B|nr:YciI family protein [Pontibacter pudoricolor]